MSALLDIWTSVQFDFRLVRRSLSTSREMTLWPAWRRIADECYWTFCQGSGGDD